MPPVLRQLYPNTAVVLSLYGVGWQDRRRARMVCTAGPFR